MEAYQRYDGMRSGAIRPKCAKGILPVIVMESCEQNYEITPDSCASAIVAYTNNVYILAQMELMVKLYR